MPSCGPDATCLGASASAPDSKGQLGVLSTYVIMYASGNRHVEADFVGTENLARPSWKRLKGKNFRKLLRRK